MRPLLYLESQENDLVVFDGVHYKINKTANAASINLRFALKNLLTSLCNCSNMTEETFVKDLKQLKEDDKYFYKNLSAYVKEGYRPMHENIKEILLPLRLLRKGGYRLFNYEQRFQKNKDVNLFRDKDNFKSLILSIGEYFKMEEILTKKNCNDEELEAVMKTETKQENLRYVFSEKKLEVKKNNQNPYESVALKDDEKGEGALVK